VDSEPSFPAGAEAECRRPEGMLIDGLTVFCS